MYLGLMETLEQLEWDCPNVAKINSINVRSSAVKLALHMNFQNPVTQLLATTEEGGTCMFRCGRLHSRTEF